MYEEVDPEAEKDKNRRIPSTRANAPRATRSTRHLKKPSSSNFSGSHRRRNKHWNW